jgi:hypothetical protein
MMRFSASAESRRSVTILGRSSTDPAVVLARPTEWDHPGGPIPSDVMGIHGYRVELRNVAANGDTVLAERHEELLGADGEVVTVFDVVGVFTVEDGRIRRFPGLLLRLPADGTEWPAARSFESPDRPSHQLTRRRWAHVHGQVGFTQHAAGGS